MQSRKEDRDTFQPYTLFPTLVKNTVRTVHVYSTINVQERCFEAFYS